MSDIRLNVGFPDHYKTEKLVRLAGEEAVRALLRLWAWAAQNRPKGNLGALTDVDLAVIMRWQGDAASMRTALLAAGFLQKDSSGAIKLHDWKKHQPYAFHGDKRKTQAKKAAQVRWRKRFRKNAASMPGACGQHADRNAPTPTPPPTPTPVGGGGDGGASAGDPKGPPPPRRGDVKKAAKALRQWRKRDPDMEVADDDS